MGSCVMGSKRLVRLIGVSLLPRFKGPLERGTSTANWPWQANASRVVFRRTEMIKTTISYRALWYAIRSRREIRVFIF